MKRKIPIKIHKITKQNRFKRIFLHKFVKNRIEQILGRNIVLERPKEKSMGHFSTPVAFSLAKELKKSPVSIATDFAVLLQDEIFEKVEAINGFLNFTMSTKFLDKYIKNSLVDEQNFARGECKNQKILLEYISANPTGPLHIGHARGAIFGDALCRVGKHLGYDVKTEYYINDAGAQMDLLGLSVYLAGRERILQKETVYPEKYYRGEYLDDIAKLASEKFGRDVFEEGDNNSALAEFAKDEVLSIIKNDLEKAGIIFDNYVSEKSLYTKWNDTKSQLFSNGALYENDGKIYLSSSVYGDDSDRVVVRENGEPTYLAGDIIYHNHKFQRDFDKFINIWGADHHGYIPRVKAAISWLGHDSSRLEVLLSQMVALLKDGEPYKMSKRAGNYVLMSDVVEEIGIDALRFIFLTKKSDSHMEFDVASLKNNDSTNPVFYINYAHARINQLFAKANLSVTDVLESSLDDVNEKSKNLAFEAMLLAWSLEDAFSKREMQKIVDYLFELSAMIHRLYNECKVLGESNQNGLLKIFAISAMSLRVGLSVLGIKAKEVM